MVSPLGGKPTVRRVWEISSIEILSIWDNGSSPLRSLSIHVHSMCLSHSMIYPIDTQSVSSDAWCVKSGTVVTIFSIFVSSLWLACLHALASLVAWSSVSWADSLTLSKIFRLRAFQMNHVNHRKTSSESSPAPSSFARQNRKTKFTNTNGDGNKSGAGNGR